MSRKIISMVLVFLFAISTITLAAKPGDVAGNYYYTDIQTFMRGQLLDSYNVGGKTVILCEALSDYGFTVRWDGVNRQLTIDDNHGSAMSNTTGAAQGVLGAVAGDYYHTDIVTVFNGVKMESYNIGGQTVIPATNLRDLGYNVVWDEQNRRVLIDTDGEKLVSGTTNIDNFTIKPQQTFHGNVLLRTNAVTFNGEQLVTDHDCFIETTLDKKTYVPFKAFADCLGISYSWNSASATLSVSVPNDNIIKAKNSQHKSALVTYGPVEHDIYDVVLNAVNGDKTYQNLNAIIYGSELFIEAGDLANMLGFFCFNNSDFYTASMAYYLYSGLYQFQ